MTRFLIVPAAVFCLAASAQNKTLTIQDAVLKGRSGLAPKRLTNVGFIPRSRKIAYVDKNEMVTVDARSGRVLSSMSTVAFNKSLSAGNLDTVSSFEGIQWKSDKEFYYRDRKGEFLFSVGDKKAKKSDHKLVDGSLENLDVFKQGETYAYVKDNNLFVYAGSATTQVTTDGSYEIVNGKSVHRDEFGITKGTFWNNDGSAIAYYRMDQRDVTDYPIIDWSVVPAVNHNIKYPFAGGKSHYVTLHVYNVSNGNHVPIKTEGPADQYLTNVAWSPDNKVVYIAIVSRNQDHCWLNSYDAATGAFIKTLFEESDKKYIEPQHPPVFVKKHPDQFIWQSRRDGYNHLYLYRSDGTLIRQLTKGEWEVKAENGFDDDGKVLYFHANEQKPINQDFYSVELSSGKMTRLTRDDGYHQVTVNETGDHFIDNFTSCYVPREYRSIQRDGRATTLFKAANPLSEYKTGKWRLVTIKNAEATPLYGRIFTPADFDSTKRYPVIVYLYNGPHSQLVTNSWMLGGEVWYQYMAEKGFIIFTMDGRGTSWRGRDFEQAIHRRVGTLEMEDQQKGVEWLKSLPYADTARMGVHGWSYGGFMTTSLMTRHPGTFKVAVAGGPVIDWKMYEIMYGERYNDRPEENPEGYAQNNLLNYVDKLKGKLLMIHGAQDDVVVWQHSILYQRKAVENGVQLDYYVYPGHVHNVLGKDRAHLMEKVCNYFIDNL